VRGALEPLGPQPVGGASGLPDDSREADERAGARSLRDVRARVKAARALVASTPGLAETVVSDWRRAARFYSLHGVSESEFRHGVTKVSSFGHGNQD